MNPTVRDTLLPPMPPTDPDAVDSTGVPGTAATPDRTPAVSPPGYELLGEVGRGGMGVVYRARDLSLHREVAVKVLQERYAADSDTSRRFIEEAQITGQLQHPGIPPVYAVARMPDGRPFLAMKLIQGQTLADRLKAKAPVNTLAVFEAICQAVGYAHAHGVIHRDLKPQNVMVGAFGEVQVMDWGLAKLLTHGDPTVVAPALPKKPGSTSVIQLRRLTDSSFTESGTVMGTPAYMAPEQAAGETHRIGRRSDVFGLGALLCAMLTGQPPFVRRSSDHGRMLVCGTTDDAFARLDACGAEPDVIALCKECLAFEIEDRPADADAVATRIADLRRAADDRARDAQLAQAQAEVRAAEQRKRRRVLAWSATAVGTVLTVGAVVAALFAVWATRAEKATAAQLDKTTKAEARATAKADEATAALVLANQRTRSLSDAYGDFVFGIQDKLANRPGTQELRRELLAIARTGLQKILDDARHQGNADSTLVWSHYRMGEVEANLGRADAAEKEYRAGFDLARRLADADADNPERQRDLGIGYERLGDMLIERKQLDVALDLFREKLAIDQKLADAEPSNVGRQRNLSIAYERVGRLNLDTGRPADALDAFDRKLRINRALANAAPSNVRYQLDLAICYDGLAEVALAQNRRDDELAHLRAALDIRMKVVAADRANPQARRDLSISYGHLGGFALLKQRNRAAAFNYYEQARELREALASADPWNADAQSDLIKIYCQLAFWADAGKDYASAIRWYEEALAVAKKFHNQDTFAADQADIEGKLAGCRKKREVAPPPKPAE